MKHLTAILLVALLLSACTAQLSEVSTGDESTGVTEAAQTASEAAAPGYQCISQEEAKRILDSDTAYILLDVREQNEFDEGHIGGALVMPYGSVEMLASDMLPDKAALILVYCRSGRRSKIAAEALAGMGYTNVLEFGGIIDWPYEIVK